MEIRQAPCVLTVELEVPQCGRGHIVNTLLEECDQLWFRPLQSLSMIWTIRSQCVLNASFVLSHLYSELSTCDWTTQNVCKHYGYTSSLIICLFSSWIPVLLHFSEQPWSHVVFFTFNKITDPRIKFKLNWWRCISLPGTHFFLTNNGAAEEVSRLWWNNYRRRFYHQIWREPSKESRRHSGLLSTNYSLSICWMLV